MWSFVSTACCVSWCDARAHHGPSILACLCVRLVDRWIERCSMCNRLITSCRYVKGIVTWWYRVTEFIYMARSFAPHELKSSCCWPMGQLCDIVSKLPWVIAQSEFAVQLDCRKFYLQASVNSVAFRCRVFDRTSPLSSRSSRCSFIK
jgi:hypothetical protein